MLPTPEFPTGVCWFNPYNPLDAEVNLVISLSVLICYWFCYAFNKFELLTWFGYKGGIIPIYEVFFNKDGYTSVTYGKSSTFSKCLHGGLRVHFGHLPFWTKLPFMPKAAFLSSLILWCSNLSAIYYTDILPMSIL